MRCSRQYCKNKVEGKGGKRLCPEHKAEYLKRRAYTASLPKCKCGNCSKLGSKYCSACEQQMEKEKFQTWLREKYENERKN